MAITPLCDVYSTSQFYQHVMIVKMSTTAFGDNAFGWLRMKI